MHFNHLSKPPFNLDREAIAWVETQFRAFSPADKVAQLFNLRSQGMDETELARLRRFRPGGLTRVYGPDVAAEQQVIANVFELDTRLVNSVMTSRDRIAWFQKDDPESVLRARIDELAREMGLSERRSCRIVGLAALQPALFGDALAQGIGTDDGHGRRVGQGHGGGTVTLGLEPVLGL